MDDSNKTGVGMVVVALILLVVGGFCCLVIGAGFFLVRSTAPIGPGGPMPPVAAPVAISAISYALGDADIAVQPDGSSFLVVDLNNTGADEWTTFSVGSARITDQNGLLLQLPDPTIVSVPSPLGSGQPNGRRLTFTLPWSRLKRHIEATPAVQSNIVVECTASIEVNVSTPYSSQYTSQSGNLTIPFPTAPSEGDEDSPPAEKSTE